MFSSVGTGNGSFVYKHTLKKGICNSGKGSCWSFRSPPGLFFDDNQNPIRFKKIISACNCIADLTPTKFTGSHETENLSVGKELEDESPVLIECRNVYKSFGEKHILRGVSFKIRLGEAVGIIGPSGTGKSTILKIMAGLLAPDKGEVLIRGRRRHGLISDEEISGLRIGLVFQSAALFDSLTVRENVGFLLYENSTMPEDQIAELVTDTLAAVGLKGVEDRLPSELSGGMKKRVALARSIIFDTTKDTVEPEVLLYDEPTAGLDPIASTVVEDLIRSVHMKGEDALGKPGKIASYVVVTHQHSTIRRAVDRLLFLHEGRVVWQGMTDEFSSSTNPIVRQALVYTPVILALLDNIVKVKPVEIELVVMPT